MSGVEPMSAEPSASSAGPLVALSTASAFPDSTAHAFAFAARLGYDAVEVMVGIDSLSQQTAAVKSLSEHHGIPIAAIHSPCLLITQRVWGTDPWVKLWRSAEMADEVGADVVVVHPPFRWQKDYATGFVEGIADLEAETGVAFAVENMYPWKASGGQRRVGKARGASRRGVEMYLPSWDPSEDDYANTCIDLSHAATAHSDPIEMAERMGSRLRHVHLTDGTGSPKDEHLVPGRGTVGAAEFLRHLSAPSKDGQVFSGHVVLEINTRKAETAAEREADLVESLEFAREHLARPADAGSAG
jgi:sugar phosphate isomerase/epimerase